MISDVMFISRRMGFVWVGSRWRTDDCISWVLWPIVSVPSHITDLFPSPIVDPRCSSRLPAASYVFHIPVHRSTAYRNSFCLSAAYFWNSLPSDITSTPSLAIFKARLMSHNRLRELPVP